MQVQRDAVWNRRWAELRLLKELGARLLRARMRDVTQMDPELRIWCRNQARRSSPHDC